jgi:hypothetical protein
MPIIDPIGLIDDDNPTIFHGKRADRLQPLGTIDAHHPPPSDNHPDARAVHSRPHFGPGRSKLFGNSADEYLKVHHLGLSQADVTEGSGGVWERLHYDW